MAAIAVTMALTACSAPEDESEERAREDSDRAAAGEAPDAITIGWNQPYYSYNDDTSDGNATANSIINYMLRGNLFYYDENQALVRDESLGTFEKTSDDPLTVEYTVADDAAWSDGTPIDATDLLLQFVGTSGNLNTIDASDDVGNLGGEVYFNSSSPGLPLVTELPELSNDNKTLTLVYSEPFADWEVALDFGVPAHVTAMKALGIDDPQAAKDALVDAVQSNDKAALSSLAEFWNTGYDFTALPDDELLHLSSGAYELTDYVEGEYLTLTANPDYTGELPASINEVTVTYSDDPLAQVQQLQNGELDLFGPQATTDVLEALEAVDQAEVDTGVEGTYEHVDLVMDNGGPFDPATYGGDAETARQVRQAFLTAYPRQDIVDTLIKPINPDAEVRNSFLVTPGSPSYEAVSEASGMEEAYGDGDSEAAAQILAEAGVEGPIDVRFLIPADNQRRSDQFDIVQPKLADAGFNLIADRRGTWGEDLGSGTYDAVSFGWQSTSTAVTESQATFYTGGLNNLIGYSNPEVDDLFDELAVTTDEGEQEDIQGQIDAILTEDAIGSTVFQFPSVEAYNKNVIGNVTSAPLNPTIFYGYWNWTGPETE
ncbi:ABC transporter substrate-binding protein [Nocardioides zeae]|uniref:ABC transporter substrate-binding protein n=1 Tax=Nocardioides zeae TaxID=1457234 RepID=UPI0019D662E5